MPLLFRLSAAFLLLLLPAWQSTAADKAPDDKDPIVVVGTGPVSGLYLPAGGALCRLVNARREAEGVRCLVEATEGSGDNLRRLAAGTLDFALIQSDWQYHAREGNLGRSLGLVEQGSGEDFSDELRAVFSLQAQPMTLIVGPDSGILRLEDLKGRKIALGLPGSAARAAAEALIESLGWELEDFGEILELETADQAEALCAGLTDAILLPLSHPSGLVSALAEGCQARLVPLEGEAVEGLLAAWPYLAPATIPGGLYRDNPDPVASYGLRATLVTSAAEPAPVVRALVAAVFEQLELLKAQHPALARLTAADMVSSGNSAPLHAAALAYYQEQGWKK